MIEITDYCTYNDINYQVEIIYRHGPYEVNVYNDGDYFISDDNFFSSDIEYTDIYKEYEQYLKLSLEINKLYNGEEL